MVFDNDKQKADKRTMTKTKRTPELVEDILARMSRGETLTSACAFHNITTSAWRTWCREDADLDIAHARSRDDGFDALAEDSLAIIDSAPERYMTELGERIDPASVAWAKNRAEQRLKLLAKWDPKRYGDKITQEHSGPDGGPIQTASWVGEAPDDLLRQVAKLKAKG